MGVSDGNEGGSSGAVDCTVGTIVWVRRRNGSWWPGRILGSDELSASHLMSPRSGTPVKLLGRDDASVDWYNLEKSKRVKAFRCGEFDACIARAEASQGVPAKKREKYARREDAIIHALELEQQQLEMKTPKPRNSNAHTHESNNFSSDIHHAVNDPRARMRGLQDFGLRIAPPKKKHTQFITWGEASGNPIDYHLDPLSNVVPTNADASHSESSRSKRKKLESGSCEDSHVKKSVLKNSAKLPISHSYHSEYDAEGKIILEEKGNMGNSYDSLGNYGDPTEEVPAVSNNYSGQLAEEHSSSETAEETVSDSSATDYMEHDIKEDGSLTDTTQSRMPESKHHESSRFQIPDKYRDPNYNEISIPDPGVSNWHIKGKRNIRNLTKKPSDLTDDTTSSDSFKRNSIKLQRMLSYYRQSVYQKRHAFDANSPSSDDGFDLYDDTRPALVDVPVEVQKQSYIGEHVPWVSLSSKGNRGKPIVGHPIQVQALEDGSTSSIVSEYEIYDAPPAGGAFSRIAKRTQRGNRSKIDDDYDPLYSGAFSRTVKRANRSNVDDDGDPLYSDQEERPRGKKIVSHSRRSSKKKTRALSSFGSEKKHSRRSNVLVGLIRGEDRMPLVTCVPVKVVFSRILESVGRTSLISAHRRGLL